jgi:hypothetical protein
MWKLVVQFLSEEETATSVKIEKELNKKIAGDSCARRYWW